MNPLIETLEQKINHLKEQALTPEELKLRLLLKWKQQHSRQENKYQEK